MSGGKWNYANDLAKSEMFGKGKNPLKNEFLSSMLFETLSLSHTCDLYLSGDIEKERYEKACRRFIERWQKRFFIVPAMSRREYLENFLYAQTTIDGYKGIRLDGFRKWIRSKKILEALSKELCGDLFSEPRYFLDGKLGHLNGKR